MKIGIVTFHRSINYGAVLQAFALKKYLEGNGHEVEFVDYWPEYRAEMYDLYNSFQLKENVSALRKVYRLIKLLLIIPQKSVRYSRFHQFIQRKLGVNRDTGYANISTFKQDFDCVFYGSDQIWKKHKLQGFTGFDSVYWGEGVSDSSTKKIAYAASMGVIDIDKQEEEQINKWLDNFDYISIRERALFNKLSTITEKKMNLVLDPVFLLDSNKWLEISLSHKAVPDNFILFYHLLHSKEAEELVNFLSKKHKLKVIEINGGVKPIKDPRRYYQTAGPQEFISLVSKAKYVVSTSFHGVVFSLVFKRDFFAMSLGNNADRVKDLLAALKISDRYLNQMKDHEEVDEIDYVEVQRRLNSEVQKSKNFITTALAGD